MPRRLNHRVLLWTLGFLAALSVGVSVLHGYQIRRNAYYLLQRGEQALTHKDNQQALFYLRQYLILAPHDLDAHEKFNLTLDQAALDAGAKVRVVLRLEDFLMRDPSRHQARRRLIHNLLELYRYKDAIVHLQILIPLQPDDPQLRHLLGRSQAATGDATAAVATLDEALRHDAARLDSYQLLAELLHDRLGKDDEAVAVMNQMIQANPKSHEAYLVRSRFAQRRGQVTEAVNDLQRAAALAPNDPAVLLAVSGWAHAEGRSDEARRYLSRGVEQHPGNEVLVKRLADLELQHGGPAEAIRVLRAGVAAAPKAFELQVRLADLLVDEKQYAEVEGFITALERAGLPPTFPNYLRARLAVVRERWTEALGLLEKVQPQLGAHTEWSSRIHALLGACYEQLGDTDQRIAAFGRAVAIEPGWTLARYHLGTALLAGGRPDEALIELEAVVKTPQPPSKAWSAMARARMLATLRKPAAQREWSGVENALVTAAAADPSGLEATLIRAEMLSARQDPDKARTLLLEALAKEKHVLLWTALAEVEAQQGRFTEGLQALHDAAQTLGETVELRLARVRLHGLRGAPEDREALSKLAEVEDSGTAQARVLQALIETWYRLGDYDGAKECLQRHVLRQPREIRSRHLVLDLALRREDRAYARKLVGDLRAAEGEQGVLWRWGEAALLVQEANGAADKLDAARALLADVGRRRRDWSRVPLLEARIDELEGKWDRVIANSVKAIELGERDAVMIRRLVQLLRERRMMAQLEQLLLVLEEQVALPPELARYAAEAAAATRNTPRLRQRLTQLFPTPPRDYRDLLWLAQMHASIDEAAKAEVLLRKAVQVAEHIPDTWIALVQHLARTGQLPAALAAIEEMKAKMPAQRLRYALPRCWEVAGELARADTFYQESLAARPNDAVLLAAAAEFHRRADQPQQAAALYARLLDPAVAEPAELLADAHRQLALLQAAMGHTSQALEHLEANRRVMGDLAPDQRIGWYLMGRDPARRREAIQRITESFARDPSTWEEELLLVQLHQWNDDPLRARDQLAQVLLAEESPQLIAWHVRLLVRTEAQSEAVVWLAKLERWEPNSPRTRELKQLVSNGRN